MSSYCQDSVVNASRRSVAPSLPLSSGLVRAFEAIERMIQRHRERKALSAMDDRLLRDIGVTRADVDQEINKPAWRA